jgi:hypothetical protein
VLPSGRNCWQLLSAIFHLVKTSTSELWTLLRESDVRRKERKNKEKGEEEEKEGEEVT